MASGICTSHSLIPSPSDKRKGGGGRKYEARLICASCYNAVDKTRPQINFNGISCSGGSACCSAKLRIPHGCKFDGHYASSCLETVFEGRLNHLLVLVGRTCGQTARACIQQWEKVAS